MPSKKTAPKKTVKKSVQAQSGVTAFTWFLFSIFVIVSFFCIKFIKQSESQNYVDDYSRPVTVVKQTTKDTVKPTIQKVTPKIIKK